MKYLVNFRFIGEGIVEVEAKDDEEAIEIVVDDFNREMLLNACGMPGIEIIVVAKK